MSESTEFLVYQTTNHVTNYNYLTLPTIFEGFLHSLPVKQLLGTQHQSLF